MSCPGLSRVWESIFFGMHSYFQTRTASPCNVGQLKKSREASTIKDFGLLGLVPYARISSRPFNSREWVSPGVRGVSARD